MCGEYAAFPVCQAVSQELPPRTRRMQIITEIFSTIPGTTSAYAENTWWEVSMPSMVWNYLRVRGEYSFRGKNVVSGLELPPRARRIRRGPREENRNAGTTSAYAENTAVSSVAAMTARNYLRVRGEYSPNPDPVWLSAELPPRTRRILAHELGVTILMGTTSAYAENTADDVYVALHQRNYLRVRGEYDRFSSSAAFAWELPPRTRRIHDSQHP